MIYEIGDISRLSATFKDIDGVLTDPTAVVLLVQLPDNIQAEQSPIVHESTGKYYYDLEILQSGSYFYRFTATGIVQSVVEGSFSVSPTILVPQPVPTPEFTQANLIALDAAIASGVNLVKFANQEMQYNSMKDMILARNIMKDYLSQQSGTATRRQIRMYTSSGW